MAPWQLHQSDGDERRRRKRNGAAAAKRYVWDLLFIPHFAFSGSCVVCVTSVTSPRPDPRPVASFSAQTPLSAFILY